MNDLTNSEGIIVPRLVDMNSQEIKTTMKSFEAITTNDLEAAKSYLTDPENYTLSSILKLNF